MLGFTNSFIVVCLVFCMVDMFDHAFWKIIDLYRELQSSDPGHELLSFVSIDSVNENGDEVDFTFHKSYYKRCTKRGHERSFNGLMRYRSSLQAALEGRRYDLGLNIKKSRKTYKRK